MGSPYSLHLALGKARFASTTDLHVEVSTRIKEEWFNGKAYYRLHGQKLASLPTASTHLPKPAFLQWHNENRFRS